MGESFITNRNGKFLSELIKSIVPKSENAAFLVGYFYFSGFAEVYQGLKDKQLRVLVGLEIEQDMLNRVREVDYLTTEKRTRGELKAAFYDSLKDLFNETDYFDNRKQQEAFTLFFTKIKEGTLEIRKTAQPNHSKMYLFECMTENNEGGTYPGTLITGSSNLSYQGLKGRLELNAILRHKSDYEEGSSIFEELWKDAIILADKDHLAEFESSVIEKIWYEKRYSPYCMYLRVLDEYFAVNYDKDFKSAHEITGGQFLDLKYQTDAIKMALATIETHNGVIISDVVGLGKSIIASAVAHNVGLRTIIIAPPHLTGQWEDYGDDFNYKAKVFSSGRIAAALNFFKEKAHIGKPWLIIVDEAHKYRNEYTHDYNNVHNLCRGNKVMLLSATPFNNRPADIYSMVKLFQIPAKSTLQTNLGFEFNKLINRYNELRKQQRKKQIDEAQLNHEIDSIAGQIRQIISPVIIRRSRLDLLGINDYKEDLEKQNMGFAETGDPEAMEYELGGIRDLYINTLEKISPDCNVEGESKEEPYKAARYNAVHYVKKDYQDKFKESIEKAGLEYNLFIGTQGNLSKFMRRLLVQRFESSKKAFEISLEHMISTSQNILSWIDKRNKAPIFKKGFLPDIEDFYKHYKQYESFGDEIFGEEIAEVAFDEEVKKFEAKGLFEVDIKYIEDSFVEDIQADIKILEQIQQTWFGEGKNLPDPKKEHFAEILLRQIKSDPIRKIVVFSSYADTIDDLYEALKDKVKVIKYTSRESKKRRKTIELNFDAGKKAATQKDDFDVLLATDAISEGYNLHRAGTIFNYDIPYNPTRVIQRVGRINRINKKVFDRLYIYNYFPTSIGEGETRTKEIATLKMAMINAIIGEDTKVLTSDIELKSFFAEQYRSMLKGNEAESWETKYRNILNAAKDSPEYKTAQRIPHRSKVGRKTDTLKMAMINAIIGEDTKVLTGDIELKSFFAEQYKSMAKGNEAESWETKYRNILNTAKDSPEYKTAQRIPHRSKVGRKTDKDSKGVLLFGRKKDVCIFKMSDNVSDAKIILPEKAIALLEASLFECPYTVSDSFDAIYQNIKQSLFSASYSGKIDKIRRDVLDKINAIAQMNILPAEYMTSLQKAVELGALSGLDMKYIRKLKPKEFASLPGTIEQSFLDRINKMAREVDEGKECVILSEEFQ